MGTTITVSRSELAEAMLADEATILRKMLTDCEQTIRDQRTVIAQYATMAREHAITIATQRIQLVDLKATLARLRGAQK